MSETKLVLLPQPQSVAFHDNQVELQNHRLIAIHSKEQLFSAQTLQAKLSEIGLEWEIVLFSEFLPGDRLGLVYEQIATMLNEQAYTLEVRPNWLAISAQTPNGSWYGTCTLVQLLDQFQQTLPGLTIEDWPDFLRRGVMLDISRDKVPTMDTLYRLVDMLASWKINELQLYTEHTFAYQRHYTVWKDASPMTSADIIMLDRYCKERFVDLVPNQNSFGHMHRWLMHEEYKHLAEVPEGFDWPFMLTRRPFSIDVTQPASLELLAALYDELLPNFSSQYFNVGCDETFDLGKGRSKDYVEQVGKGQAYLEFLNKIYDLVRSHNRTMMFWGDIIIDYPELVPQLPADVIALEWGYEASHPFEDHAGKFAAAGKPFYVCPGTSSWLSMIGRTDNATKNLLNAAVNGKRFGARGYLITDWGDFGHWQPLPVSYLGYACGAALSWAVEANTNLDLPTVLDAYAFRDKGNILGRMAYHIGNAYQIMDEVPHPNGANMVRALFAPLSKIRDKTWIPRQEGPIDLNPEKIKAAMHEVEMLSAWLVDARPSDPLVIEEYHMAINMWLHGCKRILAALNPAEYSLEELADDLRTIREQFKKVWLERNRAGGLSDSLMRMDRMFADYEQPISSEQNQ